MITDKAKERYETAKAEAAHLKEQAAKYEDDLQQSLDARMAQLQTTEKNVAATLKAARDLTVAKLAEEEEHQRASRQHSKENDSLKR